VNEDRYNEGIALCAPSKYRTLKEEKFLEDYRYALDVQGYSYDSIEHAKELIDDDDMLHIVLKKPYPHKTINKELQKLYQRVFKFTNLEKYKTRAEQAYIDFRLDQHDQLVQYDGFRSWRAVVKSFKENVIEENPVLNEIYQKKDYDKIRKKTRLRIEALEDKHRLKLEQKLERELEEDIGYNHAA